MKKKIIIFLIIFLIPVVIILLYFVLKPGTKAVPKTVPLTVPVVTPQISTNFPNKDISYTIKTNKLDIPEKLPLLRVAPSSPLLETDVIRIAKTAGFDDVFNKITNGEKQRLYIFSSSSAYMTIYADETRLSYRSYVGISDQNKKLSNDEIISKAKEFLVQKFSFTEDGLSLSSINHFNNDDYSTTQGPNQPHGYFEVNFAPFLTEYKIVTSNPDQSPVQVTIADDGTIGKAEIKWINKITLSDTQYPIKNLDDIKNQINKATIVRAYTENIDGQIFPPDSITTIVIDKIGIAYLVDASLNTTFYQPVFLLEGTGTSSKIATPIKVSLYLSAFKD